MRKLDRALTWIIKVKNSHSGCDIFDVSGLSGDACNALHTGKKFKTSNALGVPQTIRYKEGS